MELFLLAWLSINFNKGDPYKRKVETIRKVLQQYFPSFDIYFYYSKTLNFGSKNLWTIQLNMYWERGLHIALKAKCCRANRTNMYGLEYRAAGRRRHATVCLFLGRRLRRVPSLRWQQIYPKTNKERHAAKKQKETDPWRTQDGIVQTWIQTDTWTMFEDEMELKRDSQTVGAVPDQVA